MFYTIPCPQLSRELQPFVSEDPEPIVATPASEPPRTPSPSLEESTPKALPPQLPAPASPALPSKLLPATRPTTPQPPVSFGSVYFPPIIQIETPFTLRAAQSIPGFRRVCRIHIAFRFLQQVAISFEELAIYLECELPRRALRCFVVELTRC